MKKYHFIFAAYFYLLFGLVSLVFAQVVIGKDKPDKSAILEINSDDKGLLIPRVSASKIKNPVEGLLIWDIDNKCLSFYNDEWHCISLSKTPISQPPKKDKSEKETQPTQFLPVTDPYELVDGRMPIFDGLFTNLQENPGLDKYITEDFYNQIFSERGGYFIGPKVRGNGGFSHINVITQNDATTGKKVTAYKHFKAAVNFLYTKGGRYAKLFNEGGKEAIKRELAAMTAHMWQETKGFKYNVEQGYHPISDTYAYGGYHGRGPHQISYDSNYTLVSKFIFGGNTLMRGGKFNYQGKNYKIGPGAVAIDGRIAWLASLWFFLEPQSPKPSMHDVIIAPKGKKFSNKVAGFGLTTSIINGGVECAGQSESKQSVARINYYKQFLKILGVTDDREKSCIASKGVGSF